MPRAVLKISVPERLWIGELTRRHPDAELRILAAFPGEDEGVVMAEIGAPDVAAVIEDLRDVDVVRNLDVVATPGEEALVQFETSEALLLLPVRDSGALLDLPFTIQDGRAVWEITATRDRLSRLGDQLRTLDIDFTVESVTQLVETETLLTERQATLVARAVAEGYYDTPRECTVTELAEAVGIAKSTASETLHRAEGKIIKEFVEDADLS